MVLLLLSLLLLILLLLQLLILVLLLLSPLKIDTEAAVWGEESPFHKVELVVVLEQEGNTIPIPGGEW